MTPTTAGNDTRRGGIAVEDRRDGRVTGMDSAAASRAVLRASGNALLAMMTRAERVMVLRAAEPVSYPAGHVLAVPGEPIRHVYLPDAGLVSLLADLPEEGMLEVGLIGREGLVGLPALLGDPVASLRAMVQIASHGRRIEAATLQMLADGSRNLRSLLRQFSMLMLAQAAHGAACNAAHPLEQRIARWLLSVADRVGPNLPLTQDHLAAMLGARRPTVNLMLQQMRRAGLVRHARAQLAIADRAALEATACPCYHRLRAVQERLFPGRLGEVPGQMSGG
ncbi:Crp/Fnr family transcriptional regulator [Paracraurococcus lichenis]|uniref:Crp/Fnr family transcriptional regulator n=1 Tax=Paracraurococcus lichenis TaxID=3064888 RepID=A0ABT9DYU4_9PROT|nr:Crp/Fnr family transcriptional regulator [Paracraurococcus sp. LOR1-02]MDO9709074.1 Crp/Fnr family transcriptional regulator [Paracraurococcus sp. LOR1-02]